MFLKNHVIMEIFTSFFNFYFMSMEIFTSNLLHFGSFDEDSLGYEFYPSMVACVH